MPLRSALLAAVLGLGLVAEGGGTGLSPPTGTAMLEALPGRVTETWRRGRVRFDGSLGTAGTRLAIAVRDDETILSRSVRQAKAIEVR